MLKLRKPQCVWAQWDGTMEAPLPKILRSDLATTLLLTSVEKSWTATSKHACEAKRQKTHGDAEDKMVAGMKKLTKPNDTNDWGYSLGEPVLSRQPLVNQILEYTTFENGERR
ncbi:uncharacterized protein LOC120354476 isoform X1 [Nilaparvata lugens]|uniref:uncharacterized protein LOC120354476 isoform X1 n=1 Tax=Nilaparvata lugens TaxID=108931 RepID=UPI00193D77DE|nr:uncharacterized protein LOC120354476 isoform X1 [Nilaparvata lugens]